MFAECWSNVGDVGTTFCKPGAVFASSGLIRLEGDLRRLVPVIYTLRGWVSTANKYCKYHIILSGCMLCEFYVNNIHFPDYKSFVGRLIFTNFV